jgi:iron complex transport system substrate-binding protein
VTRRPRAGIALAALLASLAAAGLPAAADPRLVVDAAGRRVAVPATVTRVFAAGGPASIFLYTVAPEKLLGWNRALSPEEQAFLPPRFAALPSEEELRLRGKAVPLLPRVSVQQLTPAPVALAAGLVGPG